MVLELQEIKREITEVETKLDDLMAADTTQLYFNVDSMKKLTEVGECATWLYDEELLARLVVVMLFLLVDMTFIVSHRHCPCYEHTVTAYPQHTCGSCGFKLLVYRINNKFWS